MLYKSEAGRPGPQSLMSQKRNALSSSMTGSPRVSPLASDSGSSVPQTKTRPGAPSLKANRSLSVSVAEETRSIVTPARPKPSKIPSSNDVRSSLLPRPTAHQQTSSIPVTVDRSKQQQQQQQQKQQQQQQLLNMKLQKPMPTKDSSSLRNPLRRKAATIGQSFKKSSEKKDGELPEQLRVVIPDAGRPGHFADATPRICEPPAPMVPEPAGPKITTEVSATQGPKELASLRTIVNTQNLPPPTPLFPSATSLSTRYSESPGIWSWSRGSTPTSVSSHSPGIVNPPKAGYRFKQASPSDTRPSGFSPLMQPSNSPQIDLPNFQKDVGLGLLSGVSSPQDPSKGSDLTKSPVQSKSALPRRASLNTTAPLPGRTTKRTDEASKETASPSVPGKPRTKISGPTPFRPTRDGTDELEVEPSPVIQSDLPPKTVSNHKRRESMENNSAGRRPSLPSTTPVESRQKHSQTASHSATPTMTAQRLPRISTRDRQDRPEKQDTKSPVTPSSATSKKFGLFSRKNKSESDRKGPTAGTGHEGYGKYAHRSRKSSVSSSGGRRVSTSTASSTPKSASGSVKGGAKGRQDLEIDDFFLNRLAPVVINGGGGSGKEDTALVRTSTEQSTSGGSMTSARRPRLTGDSTDSLASSTGTASGESKAFSGIPPKNPARDAPKDQQQKSGKMGRGIRSFFQRSHSRQRKESSDEPLDPSASQLHAHVTPVSAARPIAHYALVDNDPGSLEDIIQNVEDSPPTDVEDDIDLPIEIPPALNVQKNRQSILLPPKLQTQFFAEGNYLPKVYMNNKNSGSAETENGETLQRRPSRLTSVGRIPRVVSRRERQHKPASQSFSRPFSLSESPSLAALAGDRAGELQGLTSCGLSADETTRPSFDLTQPFGDPTQRAMLDFLAGPYSNNEFLRFSPDRNAPGRPDGTLMITDVTPEEPAEDDIWGEYDDLIDNVLSPITPEGMMPCPGPPKSGENFELAARASEALQSELDAYRNEQFLSKLAEHLPVAVNRSPSRVSDESVHLRRSRIVSALRTSFAYSPQSPPGDFKAAKCEDKVKEEEKREDQDLSVNPNRSSTPMSKSKDQQPVLLPSPLNPSESFEFCRRRNTILFDIAERDREGPTAQTNIRSGSLMTSRWLSFGRVLFSPAHNHVQTGEQERILVIDGLGNDDWSFYCALTYTNAHVYNLHVDPSPPSSPNPAAWQPPANYHTAYHPDLGERFPFPKGFFAATVLRFPAACSEHVQDNIVSECKRVLRPGGYMEMSIIDRDMVNMGSITRKAVRGLKERTYLANPSVSLKPASDNIQRLLGRHSFDNLHRCMVRIPVAGVITRSSASSSSTTSLSSMHHSMSLPAASRSAPSFAPEQYHNDGHTEQQTTNNQNDTITHRASPFNETNLSLGDLLSDPAPSPSNDESIRKIVAKVGRWWYTRCYEIPVLQDGDVDLRIWSDKKVLRECQRRGTGFRMLIAHAQKPSEVNRRTASV